MANRWFRLAQRPTRRLAAVVAAVAVAFGGGLVGTPTSAADVAPSAPTNVRWAVVRSPQLELWWTVPTGRVPLAGYAIYRNGVEVPAVVTGDVSVGEVHASLAAQPVDRDLYFQVQAIGANGMRSVKTAPIIVNIDGTRPSVPTHLTVGLQPNGQPVLSWTPAFDAVGPITYLIYRNGVLTRTDARTTLPFEAEPVAIDLYYQVQARDQAGNVGAKTAPVMIRIPGPDTVRPTIPTDVRPNLLLNATVELSWNPSTDNVGVVGYSVFLNGTELLQTSERSVRLLNQQHGLTLGYQVQAFDAAGNRSAKTVPVYLAF